MKVNFLIINKDHWNLGISSALIEDEDGVGHMLSLGFLLFTIDIVVYV